MPQRVYGVREEEKVAFTEKKKEKEHAKKVSEKEKIEAEISELEKKRGSAEPTVMSPAERDTFRQTGKRPPGFDSAGIADEIAAKQRRVDTLESEMGDIEAEYTETYTDYTLVEMPPPEVQRHIELMDPAQRKVIDRVLQDYGYDSEQFRGTAAQTNVRSPTGESIPLGQVVRDISARELEQETRAGSLSDEMYAYGDKLLKGQLPDIPQETIDIFNKQVEEAYAPEFAALGLTLERQRSLIKEQGVQALSQIQQARATGEALLKTLDQDRQQQLLDLAASTGRSPLDPVFQLEASRQLGKDFAALEEGLTQAELGAQNLTREQMLGLERTGEEARQFLSAQRGATRAGQIFNARTALPEAGFAAKGQASGLFNAMQTQDLANQFSMFGGAGALGAPLLQERLSQPTTTQYQSPISTVGNVFGGLGGAAYGAGSIVGGMQPRIPSGIKT